MDPVKVAVSGTFSTLASLALNPNGANPYGTLAQGSDGSFYGTTVNGGTNGYYKGPTYGTVFKVTSNGIFTSLVSFSNTNGANPYGGLVRGSDGNFYGTTRGGGKNSTLSPWYSLGNGNGTVFKVSTNGELVSLYSFTNGIDGATPNAELIEDTASNFYGTTVGGGSSGYGTVFKITTNGTLTTLASFANTNGAYPYGGLIQGRDGNFYGTTAGGGTNGGAGTVFRITPSGLLNTLISFGGYDGASPNGGLAQDSDGNLYGTTVSGGQTGDFTYGTIFRMATNGTFTNLLVFGRSNGGSPYGDLIRCSDGNIYGTTYQGGPDYEVAKPGICNCIVTYGTVFRITTNGAFSNLALFANSNGANPYAGLVQSDDSNLYGTTFKGGAAANNLDDGYGTVFRVILSPALLIQPVTQTIPPGGNATFTVGALGFGPISYQWRKNGVNIAGATNTTLSLSNVTTTNGANYSVTVNNPGGTTLTSNALLVVDCPAFTVSPSNLPAITIGQAFSQTVTATGGTAPHAFTRTSGALPPGITLSSSGVLSGTPILSGTYVFTVRATDVYGCFGTNRYTLPVNCTAISISPTTLPTPRFGTLYSQPYTASGGTAPYTFTITGGSLPPGFVLSTNGVLSGMATNFGNYRFTVRARDVYGCSRFQTNSLAIGILLVDPLVDTNGWFWAQVVGPAGGNFEVLASSNLAEPANWTPLVTNNAPGGFFDFTDTNSASSTNFWPQKFYRARLLP